MPVTHRSLTAWKTRRLVFRSYEAAVEGILAPLADSQALFQFFSVPFAIWAVIEYRGGDIAGQLSTWWAGEQALIWALPLWFLINALLAPWRAWQRDSKQGKWIGNKYVYNEPILLLSVVARPEENNRTFRFRAKDAEPETLVSYKVVLEGDHNFISYVVTGHLSSWPDFLHHAEHRWGPSGSLRVNKNRNLFFRYYIYEEAWPFQVRVYMTGWETYVTRQVPIAGRGPQREQA